MMIAMKLTTTESFFIRGGYILPAADVVGDGRTAPMFLTPRS